MILGHHGNILLAATITITVERTMHQSSCAITVYSMTSNGKLEVRMLDREREAGPGQENTGCIRTTEEGMLKK